jgi:hypothetical protein
MCRRRSAYEPAHGHIVDHALAQRADRGSADDLVHYSAPSWLKKPE